jgi:hypothetical protein
MSRALATFECQFCGQCGRNRAFAGSSNLSSARCPWVDSERIKINVADTGVVFSLQSEVDLQAQFQMNALYNSKTRQTEARPLLRRWRNFARTNSFVE